MPSVARGVDLIGVTAPNLVPSILAFGFDDGTNTIQPWLADETGAWQSDLTAVTGLPSILDSHPNASWELLSYLSADSRVIGLIDEAGEMIYLADLDTGTLNSLSSTVFSEAFSTDFTSTQNCLWPDRSSDQWIHHGMGDISGTLYYFVRRFEADGSSVTLLGEGTAPGSGTRMLLPGSVDEFVVVQENGGSRPYKFIELQTGSEGATGSQANFFTDIGHRRPVYSSTQIYMDGASANTNYLIDVGGGAFDGSAGLVDSVSTGGVIDSSPNGAYLTYFYSGGLYIDTEFQQVVVSSPITVSSPPGGSAFSGVTAKAAFWITNDAPP